jgi:hypothetical protein
MDHLLKKREQANFACSLIEKNGCRNKSGVGAQRSEKEQQKRLPYEEPQQKDLCQPKGTL